MGEFHMIPLKINNYNHMKQLTDFFQDKKVNKVLDVGTGSGSFLVFLKSTFPDTEITGIDPDEKSLNEAAAKFPDFQFKKMSAENIDLPDNYFDIATISMALHHLPNIKKSLAEMQRVVKPGGWIIVNELFSNNLNSAQEVHKLYHHFISQIHRILGESHNETFKKEEIIKAVEDSGIDIQFHFEFTKDVNPNLNSEELESRVEKMIVLLKSVKEHSKHNLLKPQIEEFQEKAGKFGFQSATRVVILGSV